MSIDIADWNFVPFVRLLSNTAFFNPFATSRDERVNNADNTTFIEEVTKINQFYLELLASKPGPIQQKLKRCLAENYYQLAKLMHQQQDITNSLAFITEGLKYTQEKEEFFEMVHNNSGYLNVYPCCALLYREPILLDV